MTDPYVIVGAGLSAAMAVEELRSAGYRRCGHRVRQ